jgi:hypothetical protein
MEKYYKITKEQADLLGKIMYAKNQMFDPYCGETKDHNYLVSEEMYLTLKERTEFSKVDFTKKSKINKSDIELK